MREIIIENACENNLKSISVRIPHYQLITVTGVSGSGKTSLVNEVLCVEGQRLFFENFGSGRNASARLYHPRASRIEGLFPVVSISQNNVVRNPRSTVGTLTELYDMLRLLFARLGNSEIPGLRPNRSLFSFNLPDGWCPACKGLGVQDHIDPDLLIADESLTIREGAFILTTPNNYIVYSQVTMDVLDQVCREEGFSVDIPWKDLTAEQHRVVLSGSSKIKVLFGKHPLESRLKWTGITAKPREEGYYKGIVPVMEEILQRDRNANILRFTRTQTCSLCEGKRLNDKALSVKLWNNDISFYSAMSIRQLHHYFSGLEISELASAVLEPVRDVIFKRTSVMIKLGAGHLSLDRESTTLSGGEAQRIRLANQVSGGLRNILYLLDEPSAGLHPSEHRDLLEVLRSLVNAGNTVLMVDHDEQSIRAADWILDIGPGAGASGGKVIYNGPAASFFSHPHQESITWQYLAKKQSQPAQQDKLVNTALFTIESADRNNLKEISPSFLIGAFNVITGVAGSGKTSLVECLLDDLQKQKKSILDFSGSNKTIPGDIALQNKSERNLSVAEVFRKVIHIDASPIGRTPKSNPATYTGMSDHIRDLMASLPESHKRGYKKGQFSFVVKGGRCETCGGAGVQQIGMHFLGNIEVTCDVCNGKRFTDETLEIRYNGLSISDILELTVEDAHIFFAGHKKITSITGMLLELGLGYLKLGQPSTTLSGGEAQRVKLASELSRTPNDQTLYILDEPTTGLHMADIEVLLKALRKLLSKGNTLLCIEHDPFFILQSDWMVELGTGSADEGGMIIAQGLVQSLLNHPDSPTAAELRKYLSMQPDAFSGTKTLSGNESPIRLSGIATNNLKNIDVAFPLNSITCVTGVSGSGKSSLVYGTLFAESQQRFLEGLPTYNRQFSYKAGIPELKDAQGLVPAIALQKKNPVKNPRSTLATYTGLYDLYRLLFSRLAHSKQDVSRPFSTAFSYNTEEGACPECKGIGSLWMCDPDKLVTATGKPLISGAMDGTRTGQFYGDPVGQYVATLLTVGKEYHIDFSVPYSDLEDKTREIALYGCGDKVFTVEWRYKRGNHEGIHRLSTTWPGFMKLVETEYLRKHGDDRGEAMLALMKSDTCRHCNGYRLKPEMLLFTVNGLHIGQVTEMTAEEALGWFSEGFQELFTREIEQQAAAVLWENIAERLEALQKAGLGYISTGRIVGTLSGGEFQRLQLAGLVRAPLTGVAYILDEPSFGLHRNDVGRISDLVLSLNRNGNTVIMVDHSPLMQSISHNTVELGPGAGNHGGEVTYSGPSAHYHILNRQETPDIRITGIPGPGLYIEKAYANTLKHIAVEISSGIMTAITGVSGSGKTSLLDRVIWQSYSAGRPLNCEGFRGTENFSGLIYFEQPLPGTGQSATVGGKLGLLETVAAMFTATDESKSRKLKRSHFIPGSRDGRCPVCEGAGTIRVSMDFITDVFPPCERCGGTGFRDEVADIRVGELSIHDVLHFPMAELTTFLNVHHRQKSGTVLNHIFELVNKTGLGHLSPGRSLKTLSTGELQRLKLVAGLSGSAGTNQLILLDEPTGGLHPRDVEKLISLFSELVQKGHTLVCVTHEPMMMEAASHIIELGPGGGDKGGSVIS